MRLIVFSMVGMFFVVWLLAWAISHSFLIISVGSIIVALFVVFVLIFLRRENLI